MEEDDFEESDDREIDWESLSEEEIDKISRIGDLRIAYIGKFGPTLYLDFMDGNSTKLLDEKIAALEYCINNDTIAIDIEVLEKYPGPDVYWDYR